MKRILIITLALIFGLSAAGLAAGTFSGRWATDITITTPQTPVFGVRSVLTVDYRIAGWRFGSVSTLDANWPDVPDLGEGWVRQDFHADGPLGAFTLTNHLRFVPATPAFTFLRSTAAVALAGVDFETRFLVVEGGSGLRFRVGGVVDPELLPLVRATAYFGSLAFDPIVPVPGEWHAPADLRTHHLTLRGLDLDVRMRFFSFILDIDADFVTGFEDITFTVPAFPLGIPGFTLGFAVEYSLTAKTVRLTPAIALTGLGVHFVPFISIVPLDAAGRLVGDDIEGLRLEGLRLTWAVDPRVTFTYEWDGVPGWPWIAGRRPAIPAVLPRLDYQQRIMVRSVMVPITFDAAFAWLHPGAMPMFPQDIELDLSVALMPGLSLRTGVDIRHALPFALTFGFTVDW